MAALQQSHRCHGAQNPLQLADFGQVTLPVDRASSGIKAQGEVIGGGTAGELEKPGGIAQGGEGVIVRQKVVAPVAAGDQVQEELDRAEIVAQMQIAGGLDAGKNSQFSHRFEVWIPVPLYRAITLQFPE